MDASLMEVINCSLNSSLIEEISNKASSDVKGNSFNSASVPTLYFLLLLSFNFNSIEELKEIIWIKKVSLYKDFFKFSIY